MRYLGGWPNLYPWRGIDYPVLDLYFTARAGNGSTARPLDEVEACVWMRPEEIDPATLAFATIHMAFGLYTSGSARGDAGVPPAQGRDDEGSPAM